MSLFRRMKRFKLRRLSVCKIYIADGLHYQPDYDGMFGEYFSVWKEHFLSIKILIGNKIRKDPIYKCKYVPKSKINALYPSKNNKYYRDYGYITDYFHFGKKTKISLDEIEELNSILNEKNNSSN